MVASPPAAPPMRMELDVYSGSSVRATRAVATATASSSSSSSSSLSAAAASTAHDDANWVARAGYETRGRLRCTANAELTRALTIDSVTVEWYGVEGVDERWVGGKDDAEVVASRVTKGLRAGERYIAKSPPGEVARSVEIEPGRTVSFKFGVNLPPGLAPTFKGQVSRYRYDVVCKATTSTGECAEIRAPITVRTSANGMDFDGDSDIDDDDANGLAETFSMTDLMAPWIHIEDTVPPESPTFNGGTLNSPRALSRSPMWLDVGDPHTPRASTSHVVPKTPPSRHLRGEKSKAYVVSLGDEKLMKVMFRKPAPKCSIGGELAGILDFTCAQNARAENIVITLESEEIIHARSEKSADGRPPTFRKIWIETSECVEHLDTSHFVMNLPLNTPGNFRTPSVELKWLLRFDIRVVRKKPAGEFVAFFKGVKETAEYTSVEWVFPLEL